MKVEVNSLNHEDHVRYAIDQKRAVDNSSLIKLIAQATIRPASAESSSTLTTSHLEILNLRKESSFSWTSFFPPINLNIALAFSSEFFSYVEKGRHRLASFLATKEENLKGEVAIKTLFSTLEQLHSMYKTIESQRNGMKQG